MTMATLGVLWLTTTLFITFTLAAYSPSDEERLLKDLLATHHPLARPGKNNETLVVSFGISLQHFELDESKEEMQAVVWYNYQWKVPNLAWNHSDYGGIKSIRLPPSKIWHPDIQLYNTKVKEDKVETLIVVYSDGTGNWVPVHNVVIGCTVDLTYFPFDNQTCTLKFGSWTYDGSKINITSRMNRIDTSNYTPNKAWDLRETPAVRSVKIYECCPEPYMDLTYTMNIVRRSSFFLTVYVGPAIILTLLGAAIFILPPGSGQKITLGCALLICYGIFFLELGVILPPVHIGTPILDTYYSAIYAMLAVSVFLSAIINNLVSRTYTPPACVKKVIIKGLGRLVCVEETPYIAMANDDVELCEIKSKGEEKDGHRDWLLVGKVLDRVFLVLYIVLAVIVTFAILIQYSTK